jgi:hypothetical protein
MSASRGGVANNVHTKKTLDSALTADTNAHSLEVGDETFNLSDRLGINQKIINIDHNDHGFVNEETWIEFRRY